MALSTDSIIVSVVLGRIGHSFNFILLGYRPGQLGPRAASVNVIGLV